MYVISYSTGHYNDCWVPFRAATEIDEAIYWLQHAAAKAYENRVAVWRFDEGAPVKTWIYDSVRAMRLSISDPDKLLNEEE